MHKRSKGRGGRVQQRFHLRWHQGGKHNLPTPPIPTPGQEIPESEMFRFHLVSSNDIRKIMMAFPSKKALGFDKGPMPIIKGN